MTRQDLLNQRLKLYVEAEESILTTGQTYQIGDRLLTRANLKEIEKMIENLLSQGAILEGMEQKRVKSVARVVFYDN